jgi:YVTN family beta-propeller protein
MRFFPVLFLIPLLASAERLYVANSGENSISVVDTAANRVLATIPVAGEPKGLAVWRDVDSTKNGRVYVSIVGKNDGKNVLEVVDPVTFKVVNTAPVSGKPGAIALSPDGRKVFVALEGQAAIDVIDTASMLRVRTIDLTGGSPKNLYITPDMTRMIAVGGRKLSVINVRNERVEFAIDLDGPAEALAIESDRHSFIQRLFVAVSGFRGFEVFDYASRKVTGKVPVSGMIADLIVSRNVLWVVTDSVEQFSLPDLKKINSVPGGPGEIVCSSRCYVANPGGNIAVMGTKEQIPVGKAPGRMVIQ